MSCDLQSVSQIITTKRLKFDRYMFKMVLFQCTRLKIVRLQVLLLP